MKERLDGVRPRRKTLEPHCLAAVLALYALACRGGMSWGGSESFSLMLMALEYLSFGKIRRATMCRVLR